MSKSCGCKKAAETIGVGVGVLLLLTIMLFGTGALGAYLTQQAWPAFVRPWTHDFTNMASRYEVESAIHSALFKTTCETKGYRTTYCTDTPYYAPYQAPKK